MTNLDPIVRALREQLPELEILEYEPMRAHCSFRIGGPARALVRPASAEETAAVCRIVRDGGAQPLLIGNGTNLLVTDGDVNRIVVQMGERMAEVARTDATHLRAGAGIPLARLAQAALGCGLAGLEFAHGIPGSLGGGVFMNAGANSSPVRLCSAAKTAAWARVTPAPAERTVSPSSSRRVRPPAIFTTKASTPSSATSRLEPFPRKKGVTPACRAVFRRTDSSSWLLGRAMRAAGPPILKEVWRDMGSPSRSSRPGKVRRSSSCSDPKRSMRSLPLGLVSCIVFIISNRIIKK